MRKTYKFLLFTILTALLSSSAFAGAGRGVFYNTMRNKAMGNVGILSAKGATAFINNPALLTRGEVSVRPLTLQLVINKDNQDFINILKDHSEELSRFSALDPDTLEQIYNDLTDIDNKWLKSEIPASSAITIRNIGIAAYLSTDFQFRLDKGIYEPKLYTRGSIDFVTTVGFGRGLDMVMPGLKVGVAAKFISRRVSESSKLILEDAQDQQDIIDQLTSQFKPTMRGFGIDIGGLYKLSERLEVGAVLADVVGDIDEDDIEPNLKLGANYNLPGRISTEINFVDMFNTDGTSFFNRVHIGAEMDLLMFKFRGGFNQGYPTFGAGINLVVASVDVAYWTEEQGDIPGFDGETFLGAQINLGF